VGDSHSVDAPGYGSLDSIRRTDLESSLFRLRHHPVLRGGAPRGPAVFAEAVRYRAASHQQPHADDSVCCSPTAPATWESVWIGPSNPTGLRGSSGSSILTPSSCRGGMMWTAGSAGASSHRERVSSTASRSNRRGSRTDRGWRRPVQPVTLTQHGWIVVSRRSASGVPPQTGRTANDTMPPRSTAPIAVR